MSHGTQIVACIGHTVPTIKRDGRKGMAAVTKRRRIASGRVVEPSGSAHRCSNRSKRIDNRMARILAVHTRMEFAVRAKLPAPDRYRTVTRQTQTQTDTRTVTARTLINNTCAGSITTIASGPIASTIKSSHRVLSEALAEVIKCRPGACAIAASNPFAHSALRLIRAGMYIVPGHSHDCPHQAPCAH